MNNFDRLEIYLDKTRQWRWRRVLIANSNIVAESEIGYDSQRDCINDAVRVNKPSYVLEIQEEDFTLSTDTSAHRPQDDDVAPLDTHPDGIHATGRKHEG